MLFTRPDGVAARDVPDVRRIMPFIMPTRAESTVYFEQEVAIDRAEAFLAEVNAKRERKATLFHLVLWGIVRAIAARPRLNRFVMGSRIWVRDGIWIAYSAKKSLDDDAPIVAIKQRFEPDVSFEALVDAVHDRVRSGKSSEKSHVDKELSLFLALPAPLLRIGVKLLRWLDAWNLLPRSFIEGDPLYASMFVANLGSVGLESAYHHLYEYGTIPLFAAVGCKRKTDRGTTVSFKYSFDERVEDGLYCAAGLELLKRIVEDPSAGA